LNASHIILNLGDVDRSAFPVECYHSDILIQGYTYIEDRNWILPPEGIDAVLSPEHFSIQQQWAGTDGVHIYYHCVSTPALLHMTQRGESIQLSVAAHFKEDMEKVWELMGVGSSQEKKKKRVDTTSVNVDFWTSKDCFGRAITCPKWDEIKHNYENNVQTQLDELMVGNYRPSAAGQLMLWHGLPGTGKTYALRALGREWRKWGKLHYITDPEVFFGNAQYMLNVLLSRQATPWEEDYDELENDSEAGSKRKGDGWKIIVAEDTGELLSADAKQQTGQGLSRLLNIVDGMIGQGVRVIVTRPGRCGSLIEFKPLNATEQETWLQENGVTDIKGVGEKTVAELFASIEHRNIHNNKKKMEKRMGF
jgi:hypothetical protein